MRARRLIDSDNTIHTATEGLFRAFRSRVPADRVLALGDEPFAVMRAILVWRWDITAPLLPWAPRQAIEAGIRGFRQAHNVSPPGILDNLVRGIRCEVRAIDFDRVLATMAPEARALGAPVDE